VPWVTDARLAAEQNVRDRGLAIMKLQTWLKSEVGCGEEYVRSAITGARSARDKALASQPASTVLGRSALTSLPPAAMGAFVGLLAGHCGSKRHSVRNAAVFGLLGAAIGFGTNMALSTRYVTEETVRGAVKNINTVRDAHWLAKNPIDYA
jgi:hypothetical protein